ncbi:MAG: ATP-binding protein [Gammaproteobacteria bacterium]|nr:ATP-binding protein [Gammaproteobacteria bacterium]
MLNFFRNRHQPEVEVEDEIDVYAEAVRETQEIRLIESSGFSNLASLLMVITWVGLVWGKLPPIVLSVWLAMMVVLFFICAAIQHLGLYRRDDFYISADVAKRWYFLAVIFVAMGWGIASTLMFPYKQMEQIILAFILVGVSASGISYSNVAWVYSAYVGFILVPLAVRLFYIGGEVYYALSVMTTFFLGAIIVAACRLNKSSADAIRLSLKNAGLISNLTRASSDMENLNHSLTTEIARVKNVEEQLVKAKEHAERMSRTKGDFLANMSHEIRTPMNGVIGTLQLLEDTRLSTEQYEYVNVAYKSADALLSILNDVLDLSKIEAGQLSFEAIPYDLREVVNDVVVLYALKAEQNAIYLNSKIDEGVPARVIGDPTRMRQVLVNLISNAIKFTHEGGVSVRIKLKLKDEKEALIRIEVEDTGIGIPLRKHHKLFLAFSQADGSTTRKYGGSGLGLAIVRQLVELMHGNLGVDSEPGKGSKFWFVIPMNIASEAQLKAIKPVVADQRFELNGRILLVEDNPINQMVAKKMLEKIGLKSELANDGVEALDWLGRDSFDAVLMDCQMPNLDGFEATRSWREQERLADNGHLPIIAMTANVMEGDRERCLAAGMDDYLGKPVRQVELGSILQRWLETEKE